MWQLITAGRKWQTASGALSTAKTINSLVSYIQHNSIYFFVSAVITSLHMVWNVHASVCVLIFNRFEVPSLQKKKEEEFLKCPSPVHCASQLKTRRPILIEFENWTLFRDFTFILHFIFVQAKREFSHSQIVSVTSLNLLIFETLKCL